MGVNHEVNLRVGPLIRTPNNSLNKCLLLAQNLYFSRREGIFLKGWMQLLAHTYCFVFLSNWGLTLFSNLKQQKKVCTEMIDPNFQGEFN